MSQPPYGLSFGTDPESAALRLLETEAKVTLNVSKETYDKSSQLYEMYFWQEALNCLFGLRRLLKEKGVEPAQDPEVFLSGLCVAMNYSFAVGAKHAKLELTMVMQERVCGRGGSVVKIEHYALQTELYFSKEPGEYELFVMEGEHQWTIGNRFTPLWIDTSAQSDTPAPAA